MASNSARPKRPAEDFARTHHDNDFGNMPSKKPRFDVRNPSALAPDAPEDDAILDADVIGVRGQQVKRNAVNVDGYDSDSDEENFDLRAKAKAKFEEDKSKDEEDMDMFAELEDDFKDGDDSEEDRRGMKEKKKAVRFLDEDEIEGQIHSSKSGGHVSANFKLEGKGKSRQDEEVESSSESEVDDETRASIGHLDEELGAGSKKTHAPKLDAFNMRSEQEEGRFDAEGNFVRKAVDPDAKHDIWLDGLSKKDMRIAKEAADKRDQERRQRDLLDDAKSDGEVLGILITHLERSETVLEALARFGKNIQKKQKWQYKNKNRKGQNGEVKEVDMAGTDPAEKKRREIVEAITGAADLLLTRGQAEIYDTERELLIRQYRQDTGKDWEEPPQQNVEEAEASPNATSSNMWEFRWTDNRDDGDINGPYDAATMKQWSDAGYFREGIEFRQAEKGDDWSRDVEFV